MTIWTPSLFGYPLTQILRNLWLGNCGDAAKLSVENPLGIVQVTNVCEEKYETREGVNYSNYALKDGYEIPLEVFWTIVNQGVKCYQSDENTLVHCSAGMSRSPAIVASIFHVAKTMDFDAALVFIKRRRPIIKPHHIILRSIRKHLKLFPYSEEWAK